jgi:serine/threonine-protein phosphatase PGAM5
MTSAGIAPPSNCDNGSADTSNTVMPAASAAAVASIPTDGGAKIPKESRDEASNGQGAAADLDTAPALQASSDDVVADDHKLFDGQCLKRQMHQPNVPYPAWDYNWDQRMTEATTLESLRTVSGLLNSRRRGTVRHVLLVRHGQYDETSSDDRDRVLTPLGRVQAHRTGLRLMQLAQGNLASLGLIGDSPCHFTKLHVSDMQRAKETAQIIASYLVPTVPAMQVLDPDPMLNEALPSPMIPVRPDIRGAEAEIDANHDRIEAAFAKYIYRAANPDSSDPAGQDVEVLSNGEGVGSNSGGDESDQDGEAVLDVGLRHEFEVIVGHGNVIRYFVCRGLQIPPEAWLRFSVFNCSITYLVISPSGYVSVRSLGDTGHLSYEETTFSGSHGYNW